jgi:hypothetical protein
MDIGSQAGMPAQPVSMRLVAMSYCICQPWLTVMD